MSSIYLSIIIPVYNEETSILDSIQKYTNYLNRQKYNYEVVIVNDGSLDGTEKIIKELAQKNNKIKIINRNENKGKGFSVCEGLLQSSGDYRLFIDADGATSIDHIDKIWDSLKNGFDVVIGTRNSKDAIGAKQEIKQALWKRTLGVCGNKIIQMLTVKDIWDTQCGFKVFSKGAVEKIIPLITIDRWGFDVEILVLANIFNFKIAKIPVVWKNSSKSRVGVKGYFSTLLDILKIRMNLISRRYKC